MYTHTQSRVVRGTFLSITLKKLVDTRKKRNSPAALSSDSRHSINSFFSEYIYREKKKKKKKELSNKSSLLVLKENDIESLLSINDSDTAENFWGENKYFSLPKPRKRKITKRP